MYGLSDDLIGYRDRAIKYEETLRTILGAWQHQLTGLEKLELKTNDVNETRIELEAKIRENVIWIQGVLGEGD